MSRQSSFPAKRGFNETLFRLDALGPQKQSARVSDGAARISTAPADDTSGSYSRSTGTYRAAPCGNSDDY